MRRTRHRWVIGDVSVWRASDPDDADGLDGPDEIDSADDADDADEIDSPDEIDSADETDSADELDPGPGRALRPSATSGSSSGWRPAPPSPCRGSGAGSATGW